MKKIALLILTIIIGLNLTGCGQDKDIQIEAPREEKSLEGQLKNLGSIGYKDAHHFLQDEDGKIVYVYSEKVDLDNPLYTNANITVEGYFMEKEAKDDKDIFYISKVTQNTKENTELDSSDDKSKQSYQYLNTSLGIKLEFTGHWTIKADSASNLSLRYEVNSPSEQGSATQSLPSIKISIAESDVKLQNEDQMTEVGQATSNSFSPLYQWVESKHPNTALQNTQVGPDQMEAVKVNFSNNKVYYYIQRLADIYLIEYQAPAVQTFPEAKTSFGDIIDSFQFVAISQGASSSIKVTDSDSGADQTTQTTEEEDAVASEPETSKTEETTDTSPETPAPESTETKETDPKSDHQEIMSYIKTNFDSLTNPYANGSYTINSYEFTTESPYVYLVFTDESGPKKILYSYTEELKFKTEAYFEEGDTTDWIKIEGENLGGNEARLTYLISEQGETQTIKLNEGYAYFTSSSYKFRMQYPKTWYYGSLGSGSYGFDDQPVEAGNQKITFSILSGKYDDYKSKTQIGEEVILYAKRSDTEVYELRGIKSALEYMEVMIESIETDK